MWKGRAGRWASWGLRARGGQEKQKNRQETQRAGKNTKARKAVRIKLLHRLLSTRSRLPPQTPRAHSSDRPSHAAGRDDAAPRCGTLGSAAESTRQRERRAQHTDKDVYGRLRVNVIKRQALVVFVHNICRNLLADDLRDWVGPRAGTSQQQTPTTETKTSVTQ